MQASEALQHEVAVLESERTRLGRELAVKAGVEEGLARRGAQQASAIREALARIATLEGSMAQVGCPQRGRGPTRRRRPAAPAAPAGGGSVPRCPGTWQHAPPKGECAAAAWN
jgi:hypothetical protein